MKVQVAFKLSNACFTSGLFTYYIYNERYPGLCLQALTYQVLPSLLKFLLMQLAFIIYTII